MEGELVQWVCFDEDGWLPVRVGDVLDDQVAYLLFYITRLVTHWDLSTDYH
jgi:hypothetical protein